MQNGLETSRSRRVSIATWRIRPYVTLAARNATQRCAVYKPLKNGLDASNTRLAQAKGEIDRLVIEVHNYYSAYNSFNKMD